MFTVIIELESTCRLSSADNIVLNSDSMLSMFVDYSDMMMDGSATPEYIDEPAYMDDGRYITVPPDMLQQHASEFH